MKCRVRVKLQRYSVSCSTLVPYVLLHLMEQMQACEEEIGAPFDLL